MRKLKKNNGIIEESHRTIEANDAQIEEKHGKIQKTIQKWKKNMEQSKKTIDQCQNKTSQVTLLVARGHTQNLFFPGDRPGERRERRLQCTPHIHLAPLSQ
jgi:hypothetical protein